MNKNSCLPIIGYLISCILLFSCSGENSWELTSPDGSLVGRFHLNESNGSIYYSVYKMPGDEPVILPSPLGIQRSDQGFITGNTHVSASGTRLIDEHYTLLHGKRKECHNLANERSLRFKNEEGNRMDLVVRAYNEGIAFRYVFPEKDETVRTIAHEATGFHVPEGKAFMQPHADRYPSYEQYHLTDIDVGTPSPNEAGWSFPALFNINEGKSWILITETGLGRSYCGTRLMQDSPGGLYGIRFPDEEEGNGEGEVLPSSTLPWATPWRVIMTGDSPASIIESSMITDLSPSSKLEDTEWIRAGRASWSWWSDSPSTRDADKLKDFIDLAAEMGWEYSLIDAGWPNLGKKQIRELAEYGRDKSVGLILWYHSGGHPRMLADDLMRDRKRRREEFSFLQDAGIAGIKADFFLSDKQVCINQYIDILEDAADFQLMVNYHGCTLPRGWSRTWPNLMTMEAVKGAEFYKAHDHYTENAPGQNTVWPFTRNVMGPMDYTPTGFSDNTYPHLTSYAHELALPVIYESGWIHYIDAVDNYLGLPEAARGFLGDVPADWDDIKYISGYPGKYVVLARRKGMDWYVAGINGTNETREVNINLTFIDGQNYDLLLLSDGRDKGEIEIEKKDVTSADNINLSMPAYGGFAGRLEGKN